jgi:putative endonuclease
MSRTYFVYILASEIRELYVGVTNNLERRLAEHRSGYDRESYSFRHSTTRLVYFEMTTDVSAAIRREKRLKRLSRQRKLRLIEGVNPQWRDLADIQVQEVSAPSSSLREESG